MSDFLVVVLGNLVPAIGGIVRDRRTLTDSVQPATAIACVGALVGFVGGAVSLFDSRKAVSWKRAELANSYVKDFNTNPKAPREA